MSYGAASVSQILEREIIYMNVTAFPVAVERVVHPELRGRPVVVAPPGGTRSIVTALSSEAWSSGIRKGMPLSRAVRYCRSVTVLPPNEPLYQRASRAIVKVLENFSPVIEPSGHGHVYLDITGTARLFGPPRDAAWKAQKEVRERLRLDASLGIASNKMVSRIASDVIRPSGLPSGLNDVPHGNEPSFLSPLPVWFLPGVGPKTELQMKDLNIRVIRDLAAMRAEHLSLAFGSYGFVLRERALGIDRTPVQPLRAIPSIELEKTLGEDSNDYDELKKTLSGLCEKASFELIEKKQRAGRMELRIRYADYKEAARSIALSPPTQFSTIFNDRAKPLLDLVLSRRTRVRSLRLTLTDLSSGLIQLELFPDPSLQRRLKLESAVRRLGGRMPHSN